MQFTLALTTLIAAVSAAPVNDAALGNSLAGMTWREAQQQKCGGNQEIACCNQKNSGNDNGLLNGILGEGLLGQCSKLDLAIIGIQDILNSGQCKGGSVACCQSSGNSDQNIGLINLNLCIPIGSIL
ncbi:Hydrophobin [Cordyceps fumosorosea ARSEF 2679]|uniref:Hydrophobin n=1 Tax=Cordyceps fumosorosea (strain ARSEF 2679) TaxID=1081104 RepID=A0A167SU47_CORFA|nr:Hydrophobin [Cordyceps fumosorosea ARSEF 2679]OAA59929.1 Hydrophobin [Cordyceps fumosorosea ARSEF 2679]